MGTFIVGCDLGKVVDYTAIAIIEKIPAPLVMPETLPDPRYPARPPVPPGPPSLHLRHLERVPKGTSYPNVVLLVGSRKAALGQSHGAPALVVDHTGVGVAVVDLFKDARLDPIAITITGGDTVSRDGNHYRVPKRDLVTTTQVAMQQGHLKFAATLPSLAILKAELSAFTYKLSNAGHDSYAAWREGEHDDMVLAVALAVWYAQQPVYHPRPRTPPVSQYTG